MRSHAKFLQPVVQLGKNGLGATQIQEIKKQLKIRTPIKVKMLRAFVGKRDAKELAREIALKTDAELIDRVGLIIVLNRKK